MKTNSLFKKRGKYNLVLLQFICTFICCLFYSPYLFGQYLGHCLGAPEYSIPLKVEVLEKPENVIGGHPARVNSLYLSPTLYAAAAKNGPCAGIVRAMEDGEWGVNLRTNYLDMKFYVLIEDSALDYCYLNRTSEESHIPPGTDPVSMGDIVQTLSGSTISLIDLLSKGTDTIFTKYGDYIYRIKPSYTATISGATDFASDGYASLQTKAIFDNDKTSDMHGVQYITPWFYQVNNGSFKNIPIKPSKNSLIFNMSKLSNVKPGDNIIISSFGNKVSGSSITIRFYPSLPYPISSVQSVPPGKESLSALSLRLSRPLNNDLDEKFTVLTCYKDLSMNQQGIYQISDANVVFQCTSLAPIPNGSTVLNVNIPQGKELKPGTYFLTLEGSVKGSNNRAMSKDYRFSSEARAAMFKCIRFEVTQNKVYINEFKFTPPSCYNGKGSVYLETVGSSFSSYGQEISYKVQKKLNNTWIIDTSFSFTSISNGLVANPTIQVKSSNISSNDSDFRLVQYKGPNVNGYADFFVTFPQIKELHMPYQQFDISGIVYKNGTPFSTEDGKIILNKNAIQNGTPPYKLWYQGYLNGSNISHQLVKTDTFLSTTPGYIKVLVSDSKFCSKYFDIPIGIKTDTLQVKASINRPIACFGDSNAVLEASIVKGNSAVSYQWYKNDIPYKSGAIIGDVGAGRYRVEAKSNIGKLYSTHTINVLSPKAIMTQSHITPVLCYGENTGGANVYVRGGVSPYSYLWDKVLSYSNSIANVEAGEYTLFIKDRRNCLFEQKIIIPQPKSPVRIVIDSLEHLHYNSNNEVVLGSLVAHAEGGRPPYTPILANGFPIFKNLPIGTHKLTVYDSAFCTTESTINMLFFDTLEVEIIKDKDVSCFNGYDGACHAYIRGGRPPYKVSWSNGASSNYINNLPSGTYEARVTDYYGAFVHKSIILNEPSPLLVDTVIISPIKYGSFAFGELINHSEAGSISVLIKGGGPPYNYNWKDSNGHSLGNNLPFLNNIPAGKYELEVQDSKSCSFSSHFNIEHKAPLLAKTKIIKPINCHGNSNGAIVAEASGGTPPYSYCWITHHGDSITDSIASNLASGTYEIRVKDSLGILAYEKITLNEPNILHAKVLKITPPSYAACINGVFPPEIADGQIEFELKGGTAPYRATYLDEDGWLISEYSFADSITFKIDSLSGGSYKLIVSDFNNCKDSLESKITQIPSLWCGAEITDSIYCHSGNNASLKTLVEGGVPPYSFKWQKAKNGYNENDNNFLQDIVPFSFPSLRNISAGTYKLSVKDSLGIESSFVITLKQPQALNIYLDTTAASCALSEDGFIEINMSGGIPPYNCISKWNGKTHELNGYKMEKLGKGIAQITVSDKNNCFAFAETTMNIPEALSITHYIKDVSYSGLMYGNNKRSNKDGYLEVDVRGGTPPYSYLWNNGDSLAFIEYADTGSYSILVTDSRKCQIEDFCVVSKLPDLKAQIELITPISCFSKQDGIILGSVSGGTPPYKYEWGLNDNFLSQQHSDTLLRCAPGAYSLTVTDSRGVISLDTFFLQPVEELQLISEISDADAWGEKNGKISVSAFGGTPPYSYLWNTMDTCAHLENLFAGWYSLCLTDSRACRIVNSYEVKSPLPLTFENCQTSHCNGSKVFMQDSYTPFGDGSISIYIYGGNKPYSFVWLNKYGETLDSKTNFTDSRILLDSLNPGEYTIVLKDSKNYELSKTITVNMNTQLKMIIEETSSISCFGNKTGSLQVIADGGKEPYTYQWTCLSDPSLLLPNSPLISNLFAGTYLVSVRDNYGTVVRDSFKIIEPEKLQLEWQLSPFNLNEQVDLNGQVDLNEQANFDGQIILRVIGGIAPYMYLWNNGDSSSIINYENNHNYYVTIQDQHNCKLKKEFLFDKPSKIEASIRCVNPISCFEDKSGSLKLEYSGGKAPYSISWNTGDTSALLNNLQAGLYSAVIRDSFGSISKCSFLLNQPDSITIDLSSTNPACAGGNDGYISSFVLGGSFPYSYSWDNGSRSPYIKDLTEGEYTLTITDRNFCTKTSSLVLLAPKVLNADIVADQPLCPNSDGYLQALPNGGTPPYICSWQSPTHTSTRTISNVLTKASPGKYLLHIEDSHNCSMDTSIFIQEPQMLMWEMEKERWSCAEQSLEVSPKFLSDSSEIQAFWTLPDKSIYPGIYLKSSQIGLHRLNLIQYDNCLYKDTVFIHRFDDTIACNFWISSDIVRNESVTAVDVSYPTPDSSIWILPKEADLINSQGPYAEIKFKDTGTFLITLLSYKGLCSQSLSSYVSVHEESKKRNKKGNEDFIRAFLAPNPAKGSSSLFVESPRETEIEYVLVEAVSGLKLKQNKWVQGANTRTEHPISVSNGSGLYLLILKSEGKLTTLKLIITQ